MKITSFHVRDASTNEVPVVVSIPHCGIYVPESIRTEFASSYIRSLPMTDWHLHQLLSFLPGMGVTTIYGTYNRFVADVDASPGDPHPGGCKTPFVEMKTAWGEDIYQNPLPERELQARRDLVYAPYHARLNELLQSRITRFGSVALIDVHSVSSRPAACYGDINKDVYLGDRGGLTNSGWLTNALQRGFTNFGHSLGRNAPFTGGYITSHYAESPRVSSVCLNMRRDLYLDERQPEKTPTYPQFNAFKSMLSEVFTGTVMDVNSRGHARK